MIKKKIPLDIQADLENEENNEPKALSPEEQMESFLKNNKKEHFNYKVRKRSIVSTGSLKLDICMGGGITPGLTRLVGPPTGGKTSEGIELIRQFLLPVKNRRAIAYPAEGRLDNFEGILKRGGVKFTAIPSEWKDGTCFLLHTSTLEVIGSHMMEFIINNPTESEYMFFLDSMDAVTLRDDMSKKLEESYKIAGSAVVAKKLLNKIAMPLIVGGHYFVFTSQLSSQPRIDPRAILDYRLVASSGGRFLEHCPDSIWEFIPRFKAEQILKYPDTLVDVDKNPIIGHKVKIKIKKSSNEKYEMVVSYPVRYGQTNGNSIWVSREIVDTLIVWEFLTKSGAWFYFKEDFLKQLQQINKETPNKLHGLNACYDFFDEQEGIKQYCYQMLKNRLTGTNVEDKEEENE